MQPTVHLLGAGRAGTAVVRLLARAGHPIGAVVARSRASAEAAVQRIGQGRASTAPEDAFAPGDVTLLGLPESVLPEVARKLAAGTALPGATALHLSGSLSAEILAPLRVRGVSVGSLHPVAAFADRDLPPDTLERVTFDLDGDEPARAVARELVKRLGGRCIEVGPDGKALFHAAASVASNAFVALFDLACRLAEKAGAEPDAARQAMAELASSTLKNLARLGSPAALTGPIERGEVAVLARHLDALARQAPEERELYRRLALATLAVARRKGAATPELLDELASLLADPPAS